ncbi:MAG: N-acetylmuramoyl-L-alanine amidase [Lachnospiraceae bacterium]
MDDVKKIVIDAGHGGDEPGAIYEGRMEKDDNLRLALAVGQILSQAGQQVGYTRVSDVYQSPNEKAQMANNAGADYFISFQRNAMPIPGSGSGSASLVYSNTGVPALLADNINPQMAAAGFTDLGTNERPGLVILRDTQMPAILLEVGFIDNPVDNEIFDQNFNQLANGIAQGILTTIEQEEMPPQFYQVQVAAYRDQEMANLLVDRLKSQNLPAFVISQDGWFKVRVGAFLNLDNAARMEQLLRNMGYSTVMVREAEMS